MKANPIAHVCIIHASNRIGVFIITIISHKWLILKKIYINDEMVCCIECYFNVFKTLFVRIHLGSNIFDIVIK